MVINFLCVTSIAGFYVDFMIPERNTIVEVEGPSHFVAPSKERNQTTESRYRILRRKGYTVIPVPYFANESGERLEDLLNEL